MAALVGSAMPSDSDMLAIVDAVPIVMQWPTERDMHASASMNSRIDYVAGPHHVLELPDMGPGADLLLAEPPVEHRPARDHDGRQIAARRAHQQRRRGLVAADEQHHAVEGVGADGLPRRPCSRGCGRAWSRGRIRVSPRGHHRELQREAAHLVHAALDPLGQHSGSGRCTG